MRFLEKVINRAEKMINPQQYFFEIKQKTQIELIQKAGGDDVAGVWIDANGKRFDELMNDSEYNFIERLANEETHAETLKEIDSNLYH